MGMKTYYFSKNGCHLNVEPSESAIKSECFSPRRFDETKDFRLLSAPHQYSVQLNSLNLCNASITRWGMSYFMGKLFQFSNGKHEWCLMLYKDEHYQRNRLKPLEKIKTTDGHLQKLEEILFNLIYPAHSGIPIRAMNLLVQRGHCFLNDKNLFENIVEEELVKCGRIVYVDDKTKFN